ncbi:hypothetical protein HHI36_010775 [Cryptolaemus montrouzieri]|uniref:Transmembrane protein 218 n=1 Tax=Cryptolaemus montrouzieri TaxID=559131 RepID=A0ABD2MJP4_9CUCU
MTTIGSIGIGLLILIIVWILALGIFVVGVKLQSNIAWIALGSAAVITIILISIPVEKHKPKEKIETEEKDYTQIYKNLLLAFMIFTAIIGFIAFFLFHCIEPVRPKQIKVFTK